MAEKKQPDSAPGAEQNEPVTAPDETAVREPENDVLAAANEKLKDLNDRYLRLLAEYDNFRKRSQKEREAAYTDTVCQVLADLLPVLDNLERAMEAPTQDEAYKKGVEMTLKQFQDALSKLGVSEIDALGRPFDPALHNAVMHVEDGRCGENAVAEVFQKGYARCDRVIRHAMVKVAN